jgi:hypothetical protein
MPEVSEEILAKIDELLEHVDVAFIWIIKFMEKHQVQLDEAMRFHIERIDALLHEINQPLARNTTMADTILRAKQSDDEPPPDKLPVYL